MDSLNNQRTVAFLEDLNVRLKRFDEMITQAREDITKALARYEATAETEFQENSFPSRGSQEPESAVDYSDDYDKMIRVLDLIVRGMSNKEIVAYRGRE